MKPKYSASISVSGSTFIDVYFAQPLAPETANKIQALNRFSGIRIKNQPNGVGFWITFPPIWSSESVVEEVVSILVSEGFERNNILVQ